MKLLIISNMPHYRKKNQIVGWGPTAEEISHLAGLFDEVRHIACLHSDEAPDSALPYTSEKIHLVAVPPAGGTAWADKIEILKKVPLYLKTILSEIRKADMVHVRCPGNLGLIAIILLTFLVKPKKRWVKYAGNWKPDQSEAFSYRFQRAWLHHNFHRGKVTVNGVWKNQKSHELSFSNPSLLEEEVQKASDIARRKQFRPPYHFVFVGRVEASKGVVIAAQAVLALHQRGLEVELDIIGDGPEISQVRELAKYAPDKIRVHGWMSKGELKPFLARAHFILLPTVCSEGWPKVLSEAMAYGIVPITSNISSIPHYLKTRENAWLLEQPTLEAVLQGVDWFLEAPKRWFGCRDRTVTLAPLFTYSFYLQEVQKHLVLNEK